MVKRRVKSNISDPSRNAQREDVKNISWPTSCAAVGAKDRDVYKIRAKEFNEGRGSAVIWAS